ncbi:hypothetical protein [Alloactinosynnema sp. L-07]|nr:hypothetical protein [Alloactinosynnema sp. L-07]
MRIIDIAATWADYVPPRALTESAPAGLIIFAAGPTDEGVRMVEVWTSLADRALGAADSGYEHTTNATIREFDAPFAVLGRFGSHSVDEE